MNKCMNRYAESIHLYPYAYWIGLSAKYKKKVSRCIFFVMLHQGKKHRLNLEMHTYFWLCPSSLIIAE